MKRAATILTAMLLSLLPLAASAQSVSCENTSCAANERVYRDGRYFVLEIIGSVPAQPKLSAETDAGWVRITGDKPGDKIWFKVNKRVRASSEEEAKRYFENARFKAYTAGGTTVLRGEAGYARRNMMIEMEVQTPRNLQYVTASSHGGSIEITGIDGKANAESHGGSIHLMDIGGTAAGSTMGGSIEADKIGGDLRLETAGGSISVGSVKGRIVAETAGGSISVVNATGDVSLETAGGSIGIQKCGGDLKASTAGGSIEAGDVGKGAVLETAGGSIRLTSANDIVKATTNGGGIRLMRLTKGVYAETMAGGIEAEFVARRGDFTDSKLITNAGDIVVSIPSDLALTLRATIEMANGHRIYVPDDMKVQISTDGGDYGPRTIYGYAQVNGGGPLLKLETSNGNIKIVRVRR